MTACGGGSWREAFDASSGWYMSLAGVEASNGRRALWAVGGTLERGAARRFDGAGDGWAEVDFGEAGDGVPLLNWAHAFSPEDAWVVGNGGTILHFDGAGWRRHDVPGLREPLWGVWGARPDDVWAVGGSGFSQSRPIILHFDGTSWAEVEVPALARENVFALFKVWGSAADDVRAVGQEGVVLRWDGSAWREEDTGAREDLISLWGTGRDQVVAVGGRGNGVVSAWDGTAWRTKSLSPLPGLNGVWTDTRGRAFVAGAQGLMGELDLATLELAVDERAAEASRGLDLHAVFGTPGGDRLWTVGGNLLTGASTGRFEGVALELQR